MIMLQVACVNIENLWNVKCIKMLYIITVLGWDSWLFTINIMILAVIVLYTFGVRCVYCVHYS
jgi:hypothetical protein